MNAFKPYGSNHFVRAAQGDVYAICQPIFEQLDLNYFHYSRMFEDGSMCEVHSRMDWHDHFYGSNFQTQVPLPKQKIQFGQYNVCLWQGTMKDNIVHDARNLLNFDYPLSISIAQKNYFEVFTFGSVVGNEQALNNYFNHLESLFKFLDFFKEQASVLIEHATAERFILPPCYQADELKILESIDQGLTLQGSFGEVKITVKELAVLKWLSKGLTAKKIAKQLQRSPRTIEMQINQLKYKLGCDKKSDLILLAQQNFIY